MSSDYYEFGGAPPDDYEAGQLDVAQRYRPRRTLSGGGGPVDQAPGTTAGGGNAATGDGSAPAPQATGSFDRSQIYKPHYQDLPSPIWSNIAHAARPGSIMSFAGAVGSGAYNSAAAANEMEHRRYEDSLELAKAEEAAKRWDSYSKYETSRAEQVDKQPYGRLTGSAQLLAIASDPKSDLDPELRASILGKIGGAGGKPPTHHAGQLVQQGGKTYMVNPDPDEQGNYGYKEITFGGDGPVTKPGTPIRPQATPHHAGIPVNVNGQTLLLNPDTGEYTMPTMAGGGSAPPGAATRVGAPPKQAPAFDPDSFRANLVRDAMKQNGGQPLTDDQQLAIDSQVNRQRITSARGHGAMPDQRGAGGAPAGGPPPAGPKPTVVRTGTAADGTRVAKMSDGSIVPLPK
jgi:hypothetical protein